MSRATGGVFDNRDYLALFVGQGVSAVGDAVTLTVTPLLVARTAGTGSLIGVIGMMQLAPLAVFGLLAGALADRWERRRLMGWANAGRAVLTSLVPITAAYGGSPVTALLLVAVPLGILNALFLSSYRASIPSIVRPEQVPSAAARLESVIMVGFVVGPGLAGLLVDTIGPASTLAFDAASFAVSALCVASMKRVAPPEPRATTLADDMREGLAFTLRDPQMRVLACLVFVEVFAHAPLIPALTLHVVRHEMRPATAGMIVSVGAVASSIGFLIGGRLARHRPVPTMLVSLAVAGAIDGVLNELTTPAPLTFAVAVASVFDACFVCLVLTLRLAATPAHLQGRVGAMINVLAVVAMASGTLVGGVLIDVIGAGLVLRCCGAIFLLAAAVFAGSQRLRAARAVAAPAMARGEPGAT